MHKPDFQAFRELLNQHARIFRREVPDDSTVEVYWHALRDVSLDAVQRCAALHLKRGKFFPKPAELRPKGDSGKDVVASEPLPAPALSHNLAVRREKAARNPTRANLEYRWCQLQRLLALSDLSSPQYAEAQSESAQFLKDYGDPRFWGLT